MPSSDEASYPQGGNRGGAWSDMDFAGNGAITAVKVSSEDHPRIKSFQVRYGDTWGKVRGEENKNNLKQWDIPAGDRIVTVQGTSGQYLHSLRFFTQNYCSPLFGDRNVGTPFFWHESGSFSYFSGRSGGAIDRLQAHYNPIISGQVLTTAGFQGGNAGGTPWSDEGLVRDTRRDDIRAVKAWVGLCGMAHKCKTIRGIQFKYGETWSEVHGIATGDEKEWYLDPDEYIQAINGRSGARIDRLAFITNKNQSMTFGVDGGDPFSWSGGRALYFSGTEKSGDYLVRLQCHWIQ